MTRTIRLTVGVLALQGAFSEHVQLLRKAATTLQSRGLDTSYVEWNFIEVRTSTELSRCDALIIPGGESTTISLVAENSGLLEPLREFVKAHRKPTWGTCAGLILLSESVNRTKRGGQELIGGIDVQVNRNHFGRQVESFEADLDLPFLDAVMGREKHSFRCIFIRAPVVEKILEGMQKGCDMTGDRVIAPSKHAKNSEEPDERDERVEILARLPGRSQTLKDRGLIAADVGESGDIIAVRQGNCFGTSFHPELTGDASIHVWWLEEVLRKYS